MELPVGAVIEVSRFRLSPHIHREIFEPRHLAFRKVEALHRVAVRDQGFARGFFRIIPIRRLIRHLWHGFGENPENRAQLKVGPGPFASSQFCVRAVELNDAVAGDEKVLAQAAGSPFIDFTHLNGDVAGKEKICPNDERSGIRMRGMGKLIRIAPLIRSDDEPAALEELDSHRRIRINQKVPHAKAGGAENGSFQVIRNVAAPENYPGRPLRGVKDFCIEETALMDGLDRLAGIRIKAFLDPWRRPNLDRAAFRPNHAHIDHRISFHGNPSCLAKVDHASG